MTKKIKITGSIVTYKSDFHVFEAAVKSFLSTRLEVLLFIVDNSPTRQLERIVNRDPERIRYIFSNANLGYGAGHNIALREAIRLDAQYHLVFNADTFFDKGVLEALYNFMNSHKMVGHVMPKVLYPDGRLQRLCRTTPSLGSLAMRRFLPFFMHGWFRKVLDKTEYGNQSYDQIIYNIPFLSGCFMFFRTESLKDIGLFDERFFLYLEDADMTRRMLQKWHTAYYPDSVIYHYYKKGSYKSLRLTWHHLKSAFTYFKKWGV